MKDVDINQFEADLKSKIELLEDNQNLENIYILKNMMSIIEKHAPITKDRLRKETTEHVLTNCNKTKDQKKVKLKKLA